MGNPTGFINIDRKTARPLEPGERLKNYKEFLPRLSDYEAGRQGARCMDCGIPFCQTGCPVNNIIPDWNDLVYTDSWRAALVSLQSTNNFPEFTGRVCPAPCEESCTLNINSDPVTIKSIEHAIVDKGWSEGWIKPEKPNKKSSKSVAVVGSGPAGLACAQQLARVGHRVVVYEKNDRIGGLLRYGIPDFKLGKELIDRRVEQLEAEGVIFKSGVAVGERLSDKNGVNDFSCEFIDPSILTKEHDAVVLACGAEMSRDLIIPGRNLDGVHFAMEFLPQQNRVVAGDEVLNQISAQGKHVVVIGGGDTGSDCVGTSNRQGARSITQFELMPMPPEQENKAITWPNWPVKLRSSSSHEEGCQRDWEIATKEFIGSNGKVEKLLAERVKWQKNDNGKMVMAAIPNSTFEIKADLVLFAMGFLGPVSSGPIENYSLAKDSRGNILANTADYLTSKNNVYAAGDVRRGQSLVVWAIREGRQCARSVDLALMGRTTLPL